jgi:hypothetical protein
VLRGWSCAFDGGGASGPNGGVAGGVPEFDSVIGTGDDHLGVGVQTCVLTQISIEGDATLGIDGDLEGGMCDCSQLITADYSGIHLVCRLLCLGFEVFAGKNVNTPVFSEGKEATRLKPGSEGGRKRDSTLGVKLTLMPA